jgi:hypothetical protein
MKQFVDRPTMVSQASSNGWGALEQARFVISQPKRDSQGSMIGTQIINTTEQKHPILQGLRLTGQGSGAAYQGGQPLAKGGIESFDESGVNRARPLRMSDQSCNQGWTPLDDTAFNLKQTSGSFLDHLHNHQVIPRAQFGPSRLTLSGHLGPKLTLKGSYIATQAINRKQEWTTQCPSVNLAHQGFNQAFVAVKTDHPAQPQSARNLHRHSHPDGSPLDFGFDLIGLHLAQIQQIVFHQIGVHLLTMAPCPSQPSLDRSLIIAKGGYNRLDRTAIDQQGQHQDHLGWIRFQPIKQGSFAGAKGLLAFFTFIPALLMAVHRYIALTNLSFCHTVQIRAKYLLWVHLLASLVLFRNLPVCLMNPFSCKSIALFHLSRYFVELPSNSILFISHLLLYFDFVLCPKF